MATTPIYGKKNWKSSQEQNGWWPLNLVCSIGGSGPIKFVLMMTLVDLDPFYGKVKFGHLGFRMEKKGEGDWLHSHSIKNYLNSLHAG